jgi:hypothetical protein
MSILSRTIRLKSFRPRYFAAFGLVWLVFVGCVDLAEPWKGKGSGGHGGGGAGGLRFDAGVTADGDSHNDVFSGSGGLPGADGNVAIDVAGSGGIIDAALGGSGGTMDAMMGGAGGASDVARDGSGGSLDGPITGTGGKSTGGMTGRTDAATGGSGGVATGGTTSIPDASQGGIDGTVIPDALLTDAPSDSTSSVIPTVGLVAYYPCEQANNTSLPDLSGFGHHGALESAGTGSGYKFEAGKVGNALTLSKDGKGYVSLPVGIFADKAEVTIATWIKLTTLTYWERVFDFGINAKLEQNTVNGTVYMTFVLENFDKKLALSATTDGYSLEKQLTAPTIATGVWRHIAVVIGAGTSVLYIDGEDTNTNDSMISPKDLGAIDYAYIGKSQFGGDPFIDGQIDEFRVYDRALSADEVQALFSYTGQ